jgi:hypothetical protein
MWKTDPKDKHIHKTNMIIFKCVCRTCCNYTMELGEERKGKENNRVSTIS